VFTIKGTSKDSGGSSVKQIEVSLDNGATWNLANPVSNDEGNLAWQYIWNSPSVGDYIVKARAMDWFNNLETPSTGIVIKVVSETATPTPTPTVIPISTTSPNQNLTGVDLIKAQIASLQAQLIQLLQQLIQLLKLK